MADPVPNASRRSGRPMWTPSPPRHARHVNEARREWHTERPRRTKCLDLATTGLLPAAPVFQSDWRPSPETRAALGTPTHFEPGTPLNDPCTPPSEAIEDDSPGMARAASPSVHAYGRRDHVREVLGDVSNLSSPVTVHALKDHVSPLRVQSTPLRRPLPFLHAPPMSETKTPVQLALQDWAGSNFGRPVPALDASGPEQAPISATSYPSKSAAGAPRMSARRIAASPQPPAQRVTVQKREAVSPLKSVVREELPKSSPLPRISSPSSSPSKASRIWRPARYAAQSPAMRVWDSPDKVESNKRWRSASTPPVPQESVPKVAPAARRVSTRLRERAASSTSQPAAPAIMASAPPAPRMPRTPSTPRTPRTPPIPPRPSLSAAELARLTYRHTKHNEAYTVQLDTQVERLPGARPPSPSQRFLVGRGVRAREDFRPADTERDAQGEPLCHARGPGEEAVYTTPPHLPAVRWDRRLVSSPRRTRPATSAAVPQRSCLVSKRVALDAFGNVASEPLCALPRRRVLIKRRIYDGESDLDG
ncbi:hypothetical protein MNAN1_001135 [Malassezia nana]|uniref:Uncharacterized protein n=1 Tax=Malassezia nana TaxID=180528 RepID=A0AAF0EK60_9BASI|nr:hypothetical protein MNAN1_001135 [Malassezia nana]